jgi:hypothetical protein
MNRLDGMCWPVACSSHHDLPGGGHHGRVRRLPDQLARQEDLIGPHGGGIGGVRHVRQRGRQRFQARLRLRMHVGAIQQHAHRAGTARRQRADRIIDIEYHFARYARGRSWLRRLPVRDAQRARSRSDAV